MIINCTKEPSIIPVSRGGTGANNAENALANLGVKDYIVEQGTTGYMEWEKWASGKAICYMPDFHTYTPLTMTASGNLYISEERYFDLPSGLFVDTDYIVIHEFQSESGPISIVRQSKSTKSKCYFKIYKVFSTKTGVELKFRVEGRWK